MNLILVRHGQTEWNEQRRTQGHRDSPLTSRGLRQADLLGQRLSTCSPRAFYCSDSGRAIRTAERISLANPGFPPARPDPRLRELNYGQWEGLTHDEIRARYPQLYQTYRGAPASFHPPGGETFLDLQRRFLSFAAELSPNTGGTVLVVTHSGVIRIALLSLTARAISDLWTLPSIAEASVSTARWDRGAWTVESAATL